MDKRVTPIKVDGAEEEKIKHQDQYTDTSAAFGSYPEFHGLTKLITAKSLA